MRFPDDAPVTPEKLAELRARVAELGVDLAAVTEKAIKGGGRGGQKINKTSSTVQLACAQFDLTVRCQEGRSRALNRFLALRRLVDKIDEQQNLTTSEAALSQEKQRKQKARRKRRQ